jgi:hypothetical protein
MSTAIRDISAQYEGERFLRLIAWALVIMLSIIIAIFVVFCLVPYSKDGSFVRNPHLAYYDPQNIPPYMWGGRGSAALSLALFDYMGLACIAPLLIFVLAFVTRALGAKLKGSQLIYFKGVILLASLCSLSAWTFFRDVFGYLFD